MVKEATAVSTVLFLLVLVAAGGFWVSFDAPTAHVSYMQTFTGGCSGPCSEGLPPGYCEGQLRWTGTECVCLGKPLPLLNCGSAECPLTKTAVCVNNVPQCPAPRDCSKFTSTRCTTSKGEIGDCNANCVCEPRQMYFELIPAPSAPKEPGMPLSSLGPLTNPCSDSTLNDLFRIGGAIYDCLEGTMIDPETGEKRIVIGFTKKY